MDWTTLLAASRLTVGDVFNRVERPAFLTDLDRVLFSQPFRRLANKTQVHPLYDNDHLHHRMIHSLETASVGRSLGVEAGLWLVDAGLLPVGAPNDLSYILQAACAAHDIGNPPFGHAGEDAISEWFRTRRPFGDALPPEVRKEFEHFEGNAQGFRILTRLEMYRQAGGMRLTHAVLGAFTKYPCLAEAGCLGSQAAYIGEKKYGAFRAEAGYLEEMATVTGLPRRGGGWARHPLAFLVEAADDLCYTILDLEDAFIAGDLPFAEVEALLRALIPTMEPPRQPDQTEGEHIAHLRALAVGSAIRASAQAFRDHHEAILSGRFSQSLSDVFALRIPFAQIAQVARSRIFPSGRKAELEVIGRNVIFRLLDACFEFLDAVRGTGWDAEAALAQAPYLRKLVQVGGFDLRGVCDAYTALHALTDFISGMTDRYALKCARLLGA